MALDPQLLQDLLRTARQRGASARPGVIPTRLLLLSNRGVSLPGFAILRSRFGGQQRRAYEVNVHW